MQLLNGNETSSKFKTDIQIETEKFTREKGITPHLAAILVGDDGASITYVNHKIKSCAQVGFRSSLFKYDDDITEAELLDKIREINNDPGIHGLIVQLPLPRHINVDKVMETIDPSKDVDGFHIINIGKMTKGTPSLLPATPLGILKLMEAYEIPTKGKHVVVVGRSMIVGTPMSILMSRPGYPGNATVTICHSHTNDLPSFTRQADILITAIGNPGFVKENMVKDGAVVIDVGITRITSPEKKSGYVLKGDVDFESVASKCSYITPVPGGVGPMTIVALLLNTLKAAKQEV